MASSTASRTTNLLFCAAVLLLLFAASNSTARPDPAFPISSQPQVVEEAAGNDKVVGMEEINCDGVGEDECSLMRRTLVAHIDYIYTQNHKH